MMAGRGTDTGCIARPCHHPGFTRIFKIMAVGFVHVLRWYDKRVLYYDG
jgi:hypothetical protein